MNRKLFMGLYMAIGMLPLVWAQDNQAGANLKAELEMVPIDLVPAFYARQDAAPAATSAEPADEATGEAYQTCSLPSVGSSYEVHIPAKEFESKQEVTLRIEKIPAGRVQAAIFDDGDNTAKGRVEFTSTAAAEAGEQPVSVKETAEIRDGIQCRYLEFSVTETQSCYLIISRDAQQPSTQPVHVCVGLLGTAPGAAPTVVFEPQYILESPQQETGSAMYLWILLAVLVLGGFVALAVILLRGLGRDNYYAISTPAGQFCLSRKALQRGKEYSVGRSSACDIVLSAPDVSGKHGVFLMSCGQLAFRDEGSSNGSRINSKPLPPGKEAILASGDVVLLANATRIYIL